MKSESIRTIAIRTEIGIADRLTKVGSLDTAFDHLERAHILGQSSTYEHTRVHWRMLKLGIKLGSLQEIWGQTIRITPILIYAYTDRLPSACMTHL